MNPAARRRIRCAIYTRKSSEEGLEQDFNSLDAQREACAAYVLSQASEGWSLLPEHYDDGGISGGTLERPALQRLLDDVTSGRIDIIVVYKVDRLTRSLLDFAKLVERFDASEVSFVSVTQSFNTTTSMGRLTLNMLLSFAQFEREVTAERIRDKIAQSKARGMWMGGIPPLGYQADGRSLRIVESHAGIVRDIFKRYLDLGNVRLLAEALATEGIRTPRRQTTGGKDYGGCTFTRGQLYHLLKNPVYAGDIGHKGKVYPGNHPAIIARDEWDAVQQRLAENLRGTRIIREASSALLAGKLFDSYGEPLIPVHTSKPCGFGSKHGRTRYRYYVSKSVHHNPGKSPADAMRIPAKEIEQAVARELASALGDSLSLAARIAGDIPPAQFQELTFRIEQLREQIHSGSRLSIRALLDQVIVHPDRLELAISVGAMTDGFGLADDAHVLQTLTHEVSIRLTRSGESFKLVDQSGVLAGSREADTTLTGLLTQARTWWGVLAKGDINVAELARREGVSTSWIARVTRLAFLSPEVVDAILSGQTPAQLDGGALLATGAIDLRWHAQSERFLRG